MRGLDGHDEGPDGLCSLNSPTWAAKRGWLCHMAGGETVSGKLWPTGSQLFPPHNLLPTSPHLTVDCLCSYATWGLCILPGKGSIDIRHYRGSVIYKQNNNKNPKLTLLFSFLPKARKIDIKAETQSWTNFPATVMKVRENAAQGNLIKWGLFKCLIAKWIEISKFHPQEFHLTCSASTFSNLFSKHGV